MKVFISRLFVCHGCAREGGIERSQGLSMSITWKTTSVSTTDSSSDQASLFFSYYDIWKHCAVYERRATMCSWRCMISNWFLLGMRRLTRRGISSYHLAPHYISKPKPYKNWNPISLRLAVPLRLRIAQKTRKVFSLHCNTHLNAMVELLWSLSRAA